MNPAMLGGGVEDGYGAATMQDIAELRKALDVGYTNPPTGADSIRVESLETTLKLLTFQAKNLALWNQIPKTDAYSTVEEYNQLSQYGSAAGGFVASGVLPEEDDSTYVRQTALVKYLGTTRVVTHVASLVKSVPADIIAQETANGALWLMSKANLGLYYGKSAAIPLEWDGVSQQIIDNATAVPLATIPTNQIYDMRGLAIDQASLENACQVSADNFGNVSQMFSNGRVFADFAKIYYSSQRVVVPDAKAGMAGTPMTGFATVNGLVNFNPDVFVQRGAVKLTAASSAKAPTLPTLGTAVVASAAGSLFVTADAGNYQYAVAAINQYGESLPSTQTGNIAVVAADGVDLTITDGGGTFPATAYKVYRTNKGGTLVYGNGFIVPRAKTGGAYTSPTVWRDLNEWLPQTFSALLLDMDPQVLSFKQLLPMVKMPLAVISPAIRWMQLLYGTPVLFAPKKQIFFRNIGVTA